MSTQPLPEWMVPEDDDADGGWATESGVREVPSWKLYNGEIELFFDAASHTYFLVKDGVREAVPPATSILRVIAKPHLIPWATKLVITTLKERMFESDGSLKQFSTEELFQWFEEAKNKHREKLETAGDIGHIAHDALEQSIKKAIADNNGIVAECPVVTGCSNESYREQAQNCVNSAFAWMVAHNVRWIATEKKVYSRFLKIAGTMDGKAVIDSCTDPMCRGCQGRVFKDRLSIPDWKSSNSLHEEYAYQTAFYQFAEVEETGEPIQDRWVLRLGKTEGDFEPWFLPVEYFEADLNAYAAAVELFHSLDDVETRRRNDRRTFRDKVKATKKAEKEEREEREKAERAAERERVREEKRLEKLRQKALYKALRAEGKSVAEAEAIAYPEKQELAPELVVTAQSAPIAVTADDNWSLDL